MPEHPEHSIDTTEPWSLSSAMQRLAAAEAENRSLRQQLRDMTADAVREHAGETVRDRLSTMNECVRIYVGMRDAGTPARPGWLEEEIAATDAVLANHA